MYNHLRLKHLKGLKTCDLLNLGKINVICGRNNSGKSTLLEAIHSEAKRSIGIDDRQADLAEAVEDWMRRQSWDTRGQHARSLRDALGKVLEQNRVWFPEDANEFVQALGQH